MSGPGKETASQAELRERVRVRLGEGREGVVQVLQGVLTVLYWTCAEGEGVSRQHGVEDRRHSLQRHIRHGGPAEGHDLLPVLVWL